MTQRDRPSSELPPGWDLVAGIPVYKIDTRGGRIVGLPDPVEDSEVATKKYVDDNAGGGGGNGGFITPPVELQGTDPAEAVLTLRADDAQTEHIFRVYNLDGDLAADIDFEGQADFKQLVVQNPPDTGGGNVSTFLQPGHVVITPAADQNGLEIKEAALLNTILIVRRSGFGDILEISPQEPGDTSIVVIAPDTPTADQLQVWDHTFSTLLFAVTSTGGIRATLPTADPHVVGELWNSSGVVHVSAG